MSILLYKVSTFYIEFSLNLIINIANKFKSIYFCKKSWTTALTIFPLIIPFQISSERKEKQESAQLLLLLILKWKNKMARHRFAAPWTISCTVNAPWRRIQPSGFDTGALRVHRAFVAVIRVDGAITGRAIVNPDYYYWYGRKKLPAGNAYTWPTACACVRNAMLERCIARATVCPTTLRDREGF